MSIVKQTLVHYTEAKENMVTSDASKTYWLITLWQKQHSGYKKLIAFGSRHLNDTETKRQLAQLKNLAVPRSL